MKRLRPLTENIYNERMPDRYRRPTFTKYSGETNPWDHVTLFEIECGSIGENSNLKAQQFPSTFTGQAMRWFNNRPPNSITSWDDFVQQFTSHFQSMEAPVKIEHLKLCRRESNETFEKYVTRFRTLVSKCATLLR